MYYRFEKLNVWSESRIFIKEIYRLTAKFPVKEQFILVNQLKRAVISIALNIAEGSDKKSDKDFIRYLRTSLGSINEVVTCLYIAKDLCYLNNNNFNVLYDSANKLSAMINSLIRKIDEKKKR
ncbi:MAG: S23 ribosomal protein [Berkelbacteria bacterium GW2011_GWB1_38_5]|uniref:S23 ribosomal protein n=2 Tax=Candidatus Berkelbacteria TaxID=1618330 RepID=A0A0G0LSC7_9BACT|nr:MAG: S23 ribosomal protein [Berkelbacteria bacterium GW2011_GWB1_38_5]KKQ90880.1 MAG: S23 ribosomal protein [Berkelbacteria bacterium GW2011_GWA1_39_10]